MYTSSKLTKRERVLKENWMFCIGVRGSCIINNLHAHLHNFVECLKYLFISINNSNWYYNMKRNRMLPCLPLSF